MITPSICDYANLPSFNSAAHAAQYFRHHPSPTLATWSCHFCGKIHIWTAGSQTDSNGKFKAGAELVPIRIMDMIQAGRRNQFAAMKKAAA